MPPEPRLPAAVAVAALVRQVHAAGGFATLLARGGPYGSSFIIVHRDGEHVVAYEKMPTPDGAVHWRAAADDTESVSRYIERQRRFDPDLWVVELDIVDPARFVPGLMTVS
ncbi:MAG: DUF1491 family protein [Sphingomonadaceae bacterium]